MYRSRSSIPLSLTIQLLLALFAWVAWNSVERKVSGSPYRCQSSAEARTRGCLAGDPDWLGTKFIVRGQTFEVGEVWRGHDYNLVRTGPFSTKQVVDPNRFFQVEFVGTQLAQEHMRAPLVFRLDGRAAHLLLTANGSALRTAADPDRIDHEVEIVDRDGTISRFTIPAQR